MRNTQNVTQLRTLKLTHQCAVTWGSFAMRTDESFALCNQIDRCSLFATTCHVGSRATPTYLEKHCSRLK